MKQVPGAGASAAYRTAFVRGELHPVDLLYRLAPRAGWTDYLLYEGKAATRLALGARARLVLTGEALSFFDGKQTMREAISDPLKQAERLLSSLPFPDWSAYGYIGFDVARYYGPYYSKSIAEPVLALLIPETEVLLSEEGATIRTTSDAEGVAHVLGLGLGRPPSPAPTPRKIALDEQDRDWYTSRIRELLPHLRAGHLHKAIIARSVTLADRLDIPGTYAVGARVNSRARSFCFSLGQVGGVGFPPETLLEASGGLIQTNPLAGTRPRGVSAAEDESLANELFHVAKEVKEHALSVLAAQAEVASVCKPGSVRIEDFMEVKRFRFVQHLSSRVCGQLLEGRTPWDALKALFPGITVSGLDKASALSWIDRLEEAARGPYAGAVGWIDASGSADLAIALRSAFQYAGAIHLSAGAGIVAESDPDLEYRESQHKMNAMLHSLVVQTEGR